MSTTRQLLRLFDEWRRSYSSLEGKTLVFDGPIGGDRNWEFCGLKILFLLKEPHDRNGILAKCGHDLTALFRNPEQYIGNRKSAERTMGRWAELLREVNAGETVCSELANCAHHNALLQAAVMNLKKLPGGKSSSEKEISRYAERDRHFLQRQLDILHPDVVVCGGTFQIAMHIFEELESAGKGSEWFRTADRLWLAHVHPSSRVPRKHKYDLLRDNFNSAKKAQ